MLMLNPPEIRQRLFSARSPQGSTLYLAFLHNGGCAIIRDDKIVETWEESEHALDRALDRFMTMAHDAPAEAGN